MVADLGKWVTNAFAVDVGVKTFTIGRVVGPPRPTCWCTFDQLKRDGIVGLYEKPRRGEKGGRDE